MTRRDFLMIAGISTLALFGTDRLFGGRLEDLFLNTIKFKTQSLESITSLERCGIQNRAFVLVHRGYLENQGYEDYQKYHERIMELEKYLFFSKEPTFIAIEDRVFQQGNYPAQDCTGLVVTRNMEGTVKKYVHAENGIRHQNIDHNFALLRKSGIDTICFAGEEAYHGIQGEIGTGACLWEVAKLFADGGFNIKGVEGCVYPPKPPAKANEVLQKIYMDTIQIPEV